MTLEEMLAREAIRDTMSRYNIAGDRLKVEDFVACFTEDAIMESQKAPGEYIFHYEGREAIRAWMSRWLERTPRDGPRDRQAADDGTTVHAATFVRHHLATSQIDFTGPDSAKARTYWVAWTDIGPDHAGYYLDRFRKVGERWLIAHRTVRRDWQHADSLFVTAVENSQ